MAMNWKDALAQKQNAVQQAQLQNQYAMAQQKAAMNNVAGQMGGISGLMQGGYFQQAYGQQPTPQYDKTFGMMFGAHLKLPTIEELDDPDSAFNLPIEALATMWGARFGYRWVPDESTTAALEENEDLWLRVVKRLFDAGMLVHEQYRRPDTDATKVAWKLVEKDHGNN